MSRRGQVCILCLVVVVVSWWMLLFSSGGDLQEARRFYRHVLDAATIHTKVPPLERIFKAKKVSTFFADDFIGEVLHNNRKFSRKEVERKLLRIYRNAQVAWPEIVMERYIKTAEGIELHSLLRVYEEMLGDDHNTFEELEVEFLFVSDGSHWKIQKMIIRGSEERML